MNQDKVNLIGDSGAGTSALATAISLVDKGIATTPKSSNKIKKDMKKIMDFHIENECPFVYLDEIKPITPEDFNDIIETSKKSNFKGTHVYKSKYIIPLHADLTSGCAWIKRDKTIIASRGFGKPNLGKLWFEKELERFDVKEHLLKKYTPEETGKIINNSKIR